MLTSPKTRGPKRVRATSVPTDAPKTLGWREVARRIDETIQFIDDIADERDCVDDSATDSKVSLTIIVPVFNEKATLPIVVQRIEEIMPQDSELIIVDDGSTDGCAQWLAGLPQKPNRKIICRRQNHGKGSAVRLAIRHSRGAIVTIQDADMEYDPFDLLDVIRPIKEGRADVVYGSRYLKHGTDPGTFHRFGNWLLTAVSNCFTGLQLTDMETCHKAFRGSLIRTIPLRECRFGFEPEVTAKIAARGARISEVAIGYDGRDYKEGKKIGWRDAISAFACIWRYRSSSV